MQGLTMEEFQESLPGEMKKNVPPMLLMKINNVLDNEEEWDQYRNNLLSFTSVLTQGKFKIESYVNAVRYVGFKLLGMNNVEAHKRTFPKKHVKWGVEGVPKKDIASYASAFNKSKLVMLIFEQTMIPTHILNAPIFQQAINVQHEIMMNPDVSAKVRSDAANSLLTHLKAPEVKKVELDIGVTTNTVIDDYEMMMAKMVEQQKQLIAAGADVKTIANAPIRPPEEEVIDV